jgi:hypothetical protein
MPGYVQVSDVKQLAPYVPISRESTPSEGMVQVWIEDVESILDATLAKMGYTTPITGPISLTIVKQLVTNAVMAQIMRARPNPEQDPDAFQRQYDVLMKRLRDPNDPLVLIDAVITSEAVAKGIPLRVSSNLKDLLDENPMRIHREQIF